MSFRINTNVQAMNALRNLSQTGMETSKSMTRLSTGLRITSASDDPAGLIVSEGFRAQIKGLDQAIRNNQDAMNFSKTAEGALDEVNKLLSDARSLAVASGNGATLSDSQRQANQQQLTSIVESVNRIASDTAYGSKKLLDGSAGVLANSTDNSKVAGLSFTGTFDGKAITGNGTITVDVTTAAEKASITGAALATFGFGTSTIGEGTFQINGFSFSTTASDTVNDVVSRINNLSSQTGVEATFANGSVELQSSAFGESAAINLVDGSGVLLASAGQASDTGVDAVATVTIDPDGSGATFGATSATFDQGSGLNLRDKFGNTISLTGAGNTTGAAALGQISVGSASFQIGANKGQTASLSIGNYSASALGTGVVSGKTLANISLLSDSDATNSLEVIDKAISEISTARGQIGNFMRNTLESNVRSLGIQKENLSASESSIRDVDVADETTKFTKLQILQQSGLSMLAQANSAPQSVLSLLR